jgi:hypothetical protein
MLVLLILGTPPPKPTARAIANQSGMLDQPVHRTLHFAYSHSHGHYLKSHEPEWARCWFYVPCLTTFSWYIGHADADAGCRLVCVCWLNAAATVLPLLPIARVLVTGPDPALCLALAFKLKLVHQVK